VSKLWKKIGIGLAICGILASALLMMGNQRAATVEYTALEFNKLQTLATIWEGRIESARNEFRDEIIRNNIPVILDHPEQWPDWRIATYLQKLHDSWSGDCLPPRSFVVVDAEGTALTAMGDSGGFSVAFINIRKLEGTDLVIADSTSKYRSYFALQYAPPIDRALGIYPGRLIALFNPTAVLSDKEDTPRSWQLLGGPEMILLSSSSHDQTGISSATWPLLLSQKNGLIPHPNGTSIGFQKLQIPGTNPMLLVSVIKPNHAGIANIWLLLFVVGGFLGIIFAQIKKIAALKARLPENATGNAEDNSDSSATSSINFRQIFQSVTDPLCVIDPKGQLIKTNHAAGELLHVVKGGKPSEDLFFQENSSGVPLSEFLARVASNPNTDALACVLTYRDQVCFNGTLSTSRLFTNEKGTGPVLLHFHPLTTQELKSSYEPVPASSTVTAPDQQSPFPIILTSKGGLVQSYNEVARNTCPRLDETTFLVEILPDLQKFELIRTLETESSYQFESIFGTSSFGFKAVNFEDDILLYGYPLATSKNQEVLLKQAQESFESLCMLTPAAVLLVNPRDHIILSANEEAGSLFGLPVFDLIGENLENLSEDPLDLSATGGELWIRRADNGSVHCTFACDTVKVERVPTFLLVISRVGARNVSDYTNGDYEIETTGQPMSQETEIDEQAAAPTGPALVVAYNPIVRDVTRRLLDKTGHANEAFSTLDDSTVWLITHNINPAFVAIDLSDYDDGMNWIEDLRTRCGNVPCLCFTNGETYDEIPGDGQNAFLLKPFDLESLCAALSELKLTVPNNLKVENDFTSVQEESEIAQL
jgi:PAS domain-containing protein